MVFRQVMVGFCVAAALSASVLAQEGVSNAPTELVSLSRIRTALTSHPSPLRLTQPEPTFRVVVWQTRFQELFERLDVHGEFTTPGGLRAFEQRQQLGNPWIGQPLFKINLLPFVENVAPAITAVHRNRAEQAAREEVRHAVVEMCLASVCQSADR
jgi:hypothetical protein